MVFTLLPPGNRFKILSYYEIIQLAEVLKQEGDTTERLRFLEYSWDNGRDVYDIDLISIAATPFSQQNNFKRDQEFVKDIVENRRKMGKEWKLQKRMHTKLVKSVTCKNEARRRVQLETIKEEGTETKLQPQEQEKLEQSADNLQTLFTFEMPMKSDINCL